MIDIHHHLIYGVDDGAPDLETSVAMAYRAAEEGVTHIVCTPHASNQYPYRAEVIASRLAELRERLEGVVTLSLGCDFHLSYDNMQSALRSPENFCIANSHYLLVEFSNFSISPQVDDWFSQMYERGITPIITHPERNPIVQRNPERVLQWVQLGCTVQITASIFTGFWGAQARKSADWLLKHKLVHFISTDAHETERRVPILSTARDAVARLYGKELAKSLVENNPAAVVNDRALPYRGGA